MWVANACFLLTLLLEGSSFSELDWALPSDSLSVEVISHSFAAPFKYASSFSNWMISGSSIYTRDTRSAIVLNPSIQGRHGILWNQKVLSRGDFDMTMTVYVDEGKSNDGGDRPLPSLEQTLSLWYSRRNVSAQFSRAMKGLPAVDADWSDHMLKGSGGFDAATGGPIEFDGVRVVISFTEKASGNRTPSVSLSVGSETRTSPLFSTEGGVSRGRMLFLRFRLSVRSGESVSFLLQERGEWVNKVEIHSKESIPSAGYIGVTSFSGVKGPGRVSSQVRIGSLHVKSFDLLALNSPENKRVIDLFESENLPLESLLKKDSFSTSIDQTETLLKLSRIIHKYMKRTIPDLAQFRSNITMLQKEVTGLEDFVTTLTREARLTFSQSGGASRMSELVNEIKSIHSAITDMSSHRDVILNQMNQVRDATTLGGSNSDRDHRHVSLYEREVHQRNEELAATIASNNRMTFILLFIVVMTALVMGLLFYRNLNRYARKAHIF